jgi:hypothetical protein
MGDINHGKTRDGCSRYMIRSGVVCVHKHIANGPHAHPELLGRQYVNTCSWHRGCSLRSTPGLLGDRLMHIALLEAPASFGGAPKTPSQSPFEFPAWPPEFWTEFCELSGSPHTAAPPEPPLAASDGQPPRNSGSPAGNSTNGPWPGILGAPPKAAGPIEKTQRSPRTFDRVETFAPLAFCKLCLFHCEM